MLIYSEGKDLSEQLPKRGSKRKLVILKLLLQKSKTPWILTIRLDTGRFDVQSKSMAWKFCSRTCSLYLFHEIPSNDKQ